MVIHVAPSGEGTAGVTVNWLQWKFSIIVGNRSKNFYLNMTYGDSVSGTL